MYACNNKEKEETNLREGRIYESLDGGKIINGVILISKNKKIYF